MKKSIEATLIALSAPEALKGDFLRALAMAQETAGVQLGVAKNFTGDGFATQSLAVVGEKEITFDVFANGSPQFPQGEHFMISRLRLYTGASATLNKTVWTAGTVDPDLLNSTIDIVMNGTRVFKDVPLASFTQSEEQNDSGYLNFLNPIFWFAQTDISVTIKSPVPIAAANENVRFEFSGPKLIA